MAIFSRPSSAAHISVAYITIGAIMDVWSGIWYAYLRHSPPINDSTWYWCYGFLCTGLAFLVIGLAIGRIGRSARHAELPPEVAISTTVAKPDLIAPARAPVVAPINPATAPVASNPPNAVLTVPVAPPRG